jgi:hypothetical protein
MTLTTVFNPKDNSVGPNPIFAPIHGGHMASKCREQDVKSLNVLVIAARFAKSNAPVSRHVIDALLCEYLVLI